MKRIIGVCMMALALALGGCGHGSMTKQDMYKKTENAKTRAQLESALGKPDKFDKAEMLGQSMETWTYTAADGEVVYTIINDKVTMKISGEKEKK